MKWRGREGSSNIVDGRRNSGGGSFGAPGGVKIGGFGLIIVAILYLILGKNPISMLNGGPTTTMEYKPSASDDEKMEFLSVILKDTEDVWHEVFKENGIKYSEPKMYVFHGQVKSACGVATAQSGPFYCPGDQTLYMDLDFFDELSNRLGAPGDFAISYVVAHEVGHHVQNLLGVLGEKQNERNNMSETEYNKISVAIELQADYLAGVFAKREEEKGYLENGDINEAIKATQAVGDDTLQKKFQGVVVPDAFTHGTSEQRSRWFQKGYDSNGLKDMDTFSVDYDNL